MSRIARFVVLVTGLMAMFGVMSSTAGAVHWHNTGGTAFHATGTGGTLSVGANNLVCTGATASGTAPMTTATSAFTVSGTVTFSPCTLVGQNTNVSCNYTLTGLTQAGSVVTGAADVTCVARLTATGTALCHIEGSTPGTYTNPTAATSTPGKVSLLTSANPSTLTATHSSGTSCTLGTGPAHLSPQTLTLTSVAESPILTRTG